MHRPLHIVVSVLAVLLLLKPFDCFAAGTPNREAAKCCLKGKCAPTAKSDACCKTSVPDGHQFVRSKAPDHAAPLAVAAGVNVPAVLPHLTFPGSVEPVKHPPPVLNLPARNLPLLI